MVALLSLTWNLTEDTLNLSVNRPSVILSPVLFKVCTMFTEKMLRATGYLKTVDTHCEASSHPSFSGFYRAVCGALFMLVRIDREKKHLKHRWEIWSLGQLTGDPHASNNGSTWFLECLLLLFRWNVPGSLIKLFSSQQKFTLLLTAAFSQHPHLLYLHKGSQWAESPKPLWDLRFHCNALLFMFDGGKKKQRVFPRPAEKGQTTMIHYKVIF